MPERREKPERERRHPLTAERAAAAGMVIEAMCRLCGRRREIPIAALNLPQDAPLIATLKLRLRCRGCGAKGYLVITSWAYPQGRSLFWRPVIELMVDNTIALQAEAPSPTASPNDVT